MESLPISGPYKSVEFVENESPDVSMSLDYSEPVKMILKI
jgi:hypothetical protein